jgi:dynein heavy chain 1
VLACSLTPFLLPIPSNTKNKQALKTVLVGAGALKRSSSTTTTTTTTESEKVLLLQSTCATVVPKLVPQDLPVFRSLLQGVFPGADITSVEAAGLRAAIAAACAKRQLVGEDK